MIKLKLRIIGQQLHIETGLQTISMPGECRSHRRSHASPAGCRTNEAMTMISILPKRDAWPGESREHDEKSGTCGMQRKDRLNRIKNKNYR